MCVLDSAAACSTIDADFARSLRLVLGEPKKKNLVYMDRKVSLTTQTCQVPVVGQDRETAFTVRFETAEGFSRHCNLYPWPDLLRRHPHLANIKTPFSPIPTRGSMLIGADNPHLLEALEYRKSTLPGRPMGLRTVLGWSFMGPDPWNRIELESGDSVTSIPKRTFGNEKRSKKGGLDSASEPVLKTSQATKTLTDLVNRQFEIENIGALEEPPPFAPGVTAGPKAVAVWTPVERLADGLMTVTLKTDGPSKFYEGRIPWRKDHHKKLDRNLDAVLRRQNRTNSEAGLAAKGVLHSELEAIFTKYQERGYIEPVPPPELGEGWYLPYFPVVNRGKSTPVRLVFDAKAKYGGTSLNQQILETPNRLNDLTLILMRMRKFRYVLAGDITEMFLQVRLHPDDKPYHRFIFGGTHYQWTRILFGNRASPNLSQKVLDSVCNDVEGLDEAKETVRHSCYMDDCIDSRHKESEVVKLAEQLPALLSAAGMKICKIYSNSPAAVRRLDPSLIASEITIEDKDVLYEEQKILGLKYNADGDAFTYAAKYASVNEWKEAFKVKKWTKRNILQVTASHFDPLGLASPITIKPRKFLQKLWILKTEWDDPVTDEFAEAWETVLEDLLFMRGLSFPRWLRMSPDQAPELHAYCDASSEVYACAIYLRIKGDPECHTQLAAAKARVTPIKTQSVSRSELDACVLGVRMARHYNKALGIPKEQMFYYTDSKNALFWIHSSPKNLKVYTQRRVAEILTYTEEGQWGHVPTDSNPADVPTRDLPAEDLMENALWKKGPKNLRDPHYSFQPFQAGSGTPSEEFAKELRSEVYLNGEDGEPAEVTVYGSISNLANRLSVGLLCNGMAKLKRILNYVYRFGNPRLDREERRDRIQTLLLLVAQQETYSKEIGEIRTRTTVKGDLKRFLPFIDEDGVMRSRSRLTEGTQLSYEMRHPAILSPASGITRLIIQEQHYKIKHPVGLNAMMARLQSSYAIPGLSRYSERLIRHCLTCAGIRLRNVPQQMRSLPFELANPSYRAFSIIGLDFAGPFRVFGGPKKATPCNRFILLITCLHTRAVHFEICKDQQNFTVLRALVRFAYLRGRPRTIYSDNQSSLLKAAGYIRGIPADPWEFDRNEIAQRLEDELGGRITWKFINPMAPHEGGRWERMVQSMKRALKTLCQRDRQVTLENFDLVILKAQDLLNSRPLARGPKSDLAEVLTPNHFLVGRISTSLTDGVKLKELMWKVDGVVARLWELFIKEILTGARTRNTWTTVSDNPRKGDLVIVLPAETQLKPEWQVAVVEEPHVGPDGLVRSVLLRTRGGLLRRNMTSLVHLPTDDAGPHIPVEEDEEVPPPPRRFVNVRPPEPEYPEGPVEEEAAPSNEEEPEEEPGPNQLAIFSDDESGSDIEEDYSPPDYPDCPAPEWHNIMMAQILAERAAIGLTKGAKCGPPGPGW